MDNLNDISKGLTREELLSYYKRILQELKDSEYPKDMQAGIERAIKGLENGNT